MIHSAGSSDDKHHLVKMVLDRLRKTRFLEKEIESLEKEKSMLQQEIVQQTEIYMKHMESAAEKAIVRIADYCKQAFVSTAWKSGPRNRWMLHIPHLM